MDNPSKNTAEFWVYAGVKIHKKHPRKYTYDKIGKWLIFESINKVDKVWEIVKKATENGDLGDGAKCATAKPNPNSCNSKEIVICVYTYNWTDVKDVYRVEKQLRKIGIKQTLYYKTDADTNQRKYKVNGDKGISQYISKAVKKSKKLSLLNLHNVGLKKRKLLYNIGINNIDNLINFDSSQDLYGKGLSNKTINKLKLFALSQMEKSVFKIGTPDLPIDNIIYFDIETDLLQSHAKKQVWLIGIYHNGIFKKFYAKTWEQEKKILSQFLEYIYSLNNPNLLSYSGTQFDKNIIQHALKRHNLDFQFFKEQAHYDVCLEIKKNYIFPTQSYSLKEIGNYLKYKFKNDDLNGIDVAKQYIKTQGTKRILPKKIFDYVEDDVKSIHYIIQELNSDRHKIIDMTIETEEVTKKKSRIVENYEIDINDFKCPFCNSIDFKRSGQNREGHYKYRCKNCKRSFSSTYMTTSKEEILKKCRKEISKNDTIRHFP